MDWVLTGFGGPTIPVYGVLEHSTPDNIGVRRARKSMRPCMSFCVFRVFPCAGGGGVLLEQIGTCRLKVEKRTTEEGQIAVEMPSICPSG